MRERGGDYVNNRLVFPKMARWVREVAPQCGSREATVGFSLGRKSQEIVGVR